VIEECRALSRKGSPQDTEAREAFDFLSSREFPQLLKDWQHEVEKCWIFYKWWQAFGATDPVSGLSYPRDLIACHEKLGTVWTTCLGLPERTRCYNFERMSCYNYEVIKENPWVKATMEDMPRFRPMVMFRLCFLECWLNPVPPCY